MSFNLTAIAFMGDDWNTSRARFRAVVFSAHTRVRMRNPYFRAKTVDDLLRHALEGINKYGEPIKASKGNTKEITGVVLELTNPRARLSLTESRGKLFSCIGELCWYLSGRRRDRLHRSLHR